MKANKAKAKKSKKGKAIMITLGIALLGLLLLTGCGSGGESPARPPDPITIAELTVYPSAQTLEVGQTQQYTATAKDSNGNTRKPVAVDWSTGEQALAMIDANGLLTARDGGTTTVRATYQGVESQFVTVTISRTPAFRAALPPWITYCDGQVCDGLEPLTAALCEENNPSCTPGRSTTVSARVEGVPISSVYFTLVKDLTINGQILPSHLRLISGYGVAHNNVSKGLSVYSAKTVVLRSELDFLVSAYGIDPAWGGTTILNFDVDTRDSSLMTSHVYRHPSYDIGNAASELHAKGQEIIRKELDLTGITISEKVTAFFLPNDLSASTYGEGNFSFGNGTITVNYGSPIFIADPYFGGLVNQSMARFSHEYAHELFDEITGSFPDNFACLNEGIADATGFMSGFLPERDFGPVGVRGLSFEDEERCLAMTAIHDVGNCSLWHVKQAGHLTPAFIRGLFHPQHTFVLDSCVMNKETGDSLLVYFTEAAGGANMVPVLDATKIPHAPTYAEAKKALGFL